MATSMESASSSVVRRRLPIGAEVTSEGVVDFRVWAPRRRKIAVVIPREAGLPELSFPLSQSSDGYFSGTVEGIGPGTRYGLRLDAEPRLVPDPASRFQPDGPWGLSQVIDPEVFPWTDATWAGVRPEGQVLYEMHVGAFTREGTWEAALCELPELARIGITVVEVMPVADFVGEFGWGYDGVSMFAPTRLYGDPDDFRRFVDRAHACGIGVVLDVVYNHYGPVGNSLGEFSSRYSTDRYPNEWGASPNFDGDDAAPVREFVEANVRHWIGEYHLDGLRFDATQSVHDRSDEHILTRLVAAARASAPGREILLIAENEPQHVRLVRPPESGGHGMDSLWNDDFHHSAMVRLTGHNEAYYSDYLGSADEFLAAVKHGFLYQGQTSRWQKQRRGTSTRGLPATSFVTFLQNHDQIANSGLGERIDRLTSPGRLRAMTALWLLAPQTPMFFQGQEFAASSPFLYFADNSGNQADCVAEGRRRFLSQFPTLASEEAVRCLAAPEARETFERCRLDFSERARHATTYRLHIDLLRLRRQDPLFRRQRSDLLEGVSLSRDCVAIRFLDERGADRLLIANFGCDLPIAPAPQPLLAPPEDRCWKLLWSSNQIEYGGVGTPPLENDSGWRIPGECAVVLRADPIDARSPQESKTSK